MKRIVWDIDKANLLALDVDRGKVTFEECVVAIEDGRLLDDVPHPSTHYKHQRLLILNINNYAYVVPYVEDDTRIFFKTIFPSRKYTQLYIKEPNS
ncbi:MAG TPA: toxin [Oceanospirillaceae bacterium]|jgi:hypothetical protein|nr:toxin [Oceanospirillaceae bacterium]